MESYIRTVKVQRNGQAIADIKAGDWLSKKIPFGRLH